MVAARPALLPLLRSDNQLRLLTKLLLEPTRPFTVTDLVVETGVPQPSVSREVKHLLTAGIITATTEHGRRVLRANTESTIFPDLASLLLKTTGPKPVLERLLTGLPEIDRAFVYGSWARRHVGEAGPEPADVDLMVIGTPDVREVRRCSDEASRELGHDVNAVVLTPAEWEAGASGFLRQLRTSPVVDLDLADQSQVKGAELCH